MKIGAYPFAVTGDIRRNMDIIESAVLQAVQQQVQLLVFPECALTGYPPRDLKCSAHVDFSVLELCYAKLEQLSAEHQIHLIVGSITKQENHFYNSAVVFSPGKSMECYHKRALWGWDRDNFSPAEGKGIFDICGWKVGVRICFEVRFPEYFRELYRENTDLNVILFYDVSDWDDSERYDLIQSHIRTRAVENVCHTLTVDTIAPYQTAPTALYDRSGVALFEAKRNKEGLMVYDLALTEIDFGERGRKEISDLLAR